MKYIEICLLEIAMQFWSSITILAMSYVIISAFFLF